MRRREDRAITPVKGTLLNHARASLGERVGVGEGLMHCPLRFPVVASVLGNALIFLALAQLCFSMWQAPSHITLKIMKVLSV